LQHLQEARRLDPNAADLYQRLSEAYLKKLDLGRALEAARKAVQLDPSDRKYHFRLGMVLARLGKTADAEKEFREAERLPKEPQINVIQRWQELNHRGVKPHEPRQ